MAATLGVTTADGATPERRSARGLAAAAVALALAGAYGPDLLALVETWSDDPDYSHGFLVIPIAAVILWRRWPERIETPGTWTARLGWAALAAALAARAVAYELGKMWVTTATLLPVLAALTLTYGGRGLLRRAWPALAFLVFMLPIPGAVDARLSLPLQRLATRCSCELLRLSGTWVMNEGNVIVFGADQLEVAAACNGLAMLMSLAATVSATVLLVPLAAWKRAALLASVVPIALACNVLRIAGTVWCYRQVGSEAGRHLVHDVAGYLMMPAALVLVGLELGWLSWLVREEESVTVHPVLSALSRRPAAAIARQPRPSAGDLDA